MIKRLRYKFIAISTLALLVVVVTIIGSITLVSFYRSRQEVNNVLTILVRNEGQLTANSNLASKQRPFLSPRQTHEGIFQYRFFSAQVDREGDLIEINDSHIMTVPNSAMRRMINLAYKRGRSSGSMVYRDTIYGYQMKFQHGHYTLVFLDQSILMAETHDLMKIGILLGICGVILYAIVLILFSRRAIRPIITAEKRQREFISNAGHELKTPLAVISANNEMEEMTSGESEWTKSNKEQIARLTRLINNLIALTRLNEQPNMQFTHLDASQATKEVCHNFKAVIGRNELKFNYHIKEGLAIYGDQRYYTELVNILLDNANKYCDPHGSIVLRLHEVKRSKSVQLDISNSFAAGKDIDYSKFFDRFYRADTAHQESGKNGFGIGLSMAQRIVSDFKGKINATYKDGRIHFIVTLKN